MKLDENRADFQGLHNIIAYLCRIGPDWSDNYPSLSINIWALALINWTHRQLASPGSLVPLTVALCVPRIQQLVQFYSPKGILQLRRNCSRKWIDYFNQISSPICCCRTFRRCGWSTVTVCCACILGAYLATENSKPMWKKISQLHIVKYCLIAKHGNIRVFLFMMTIPPGLSQRSLMKRGTPCPLTMHKCLLTCSSITYSSWSKSFILNSIPSRIHIYWLFRFPILSHLEECLNTHIQQRKFLQRFVDFTTYFQIRTWYGGPKMDFAFMPCVS